MLSKQQIKYINFLRQKKYRLQFKAFIAEGEKIASELLNSNFTVTDVYATKSWIEKNKKRLNSSIQLNEITGDELKKISGLSTPNEVLLVIQQSEKEFQISSFSEDITLLLDNIQDPGNLGTIIRIADWFGIKNIICSANCTDMYSSKVVQATMGSLGRINVFYEDLSRVLKQNKNIPVYGAVLEDKNIYKKQLSTPAFIIIGNESNGISPGIRKFINYPVTIPGVGAAESLNAAIATAIICSEFRRDNFV